jgi:hypothetical protein
VELFSGHGGKKFRAKRKLFQGWVEGFSHLGGKKIRVRWKENQGEKWLGGTIFRAKIRDLFWVERKNPALDMESFVAQKRATQVAHRQRWKDFQGKGGNKFRLRWKPIQGQEERFSCEGKLLARKGPKRGSRVGTKEEGL